MTILPSSSRGLAVELVELSSEPLACSENPKNPCQRWLAPGERLELSTYGLTVHRSAN